ncbi:UV excision repair protein rhp23, partial [Leucoagaricus sp. SymC.cos]
VDVEPQDTVGQLKLKIEAAHGYPTVTQKVIYSGKILSDDKTIDSCGVKEKDFFVLMVAKPKPTPTPKPEVPSTSTAAASASTPASAATAATPAETPARSAPVAATTPIPSTTPAGVDSGFLTGEALQSAISNLVEMGFPREQVLRAMRASFNNPDRAVEYLMNGIPAHLEAEATPPAAQTPAARSNPPAAAAIPAAPTTAPPAAPAPATPQANQPQNLFQLAQQQQRAGAGAAAGLGGLGGAGGAGGLPSLDASAIQDNPQIQQLRGLVAQNPALIQPLIQQLAAANPQLAQALAQNPELLFQILGNLEGGEGEGEEGQLPPGVQAISVTPEERAAIERLEALGFSRQAVIEAYFACDKNEELAANYLFEGGFED